MANKKNGTGHEARPAKSGQGASVGNDNRKRPRIRASHGAAGPTARTRRSPGAADAPKARPARSPGLRKAPLTGPRRAGPRRSVPPPAYEPPRAARELALAIATEGLEKKAIGIEILDVSGKVDYADFLVVMTGRSDRHVHAIATGLEEAMRKRRNAPLSIEGLAASTWVLMDFGDVVVHVFQEDTRRMYDIEGLWIDAGRVPVPEGSGPPERRSPL